MNLLHRQDMKYKLVIFDFDGTIADTSLGIIDSHKFTLEYFGKTIPKDSELSKMIGGALLETYTNVLGFDETSAKKAINIYRKRYAKVGIKLATIYKGVYELITKLNGNGFYIGLATLKAEHFAKLMLLNFNLLDKFDVICGMNEQDSFTKADLINNCLKQLCVKPSESILIGDSNNDLIGAEQIGTYFIGVTYGFGFKQDEIYSFDVANTPSEVYDIIRKLNFSK